MSASEDKPPRSVITCDLEGRIETFNDGAEEIFGYEPEEVIGKQRISLFSPGLVVLEHVDRWLKTAREEGKYEGETVFVRKDGTQFAARVRITTTNRDGEQLGYRSVAQRLPDKEPQDVMPDMSLATKIMAWLVIVRGPFLTAAMIPVLLGSAWVWWQGVESFPWLNFGLALFGAAALQVAANTFNDYFDWESGADKVNNEYFRALSGGSRAVELRLITQQGMFRVGLAASVAATLCGAVLVYLAGPGILIYGVAGLFSAYFYTAPPLRLVARKGLGELLIGLNFGPLITSGTAFALTGTFHWNDLLVGVPIGLLTAAILWINEFPDKEADEQAHKNQLVVVLGKKTARWGYAALLAGAFAMLGAGAALGVFPVGMLAALLALPIAAYAIKVLWQHFDNRELVGANKATIALHAIAGLLMIGGILLTPLLT